MRGASGEDGGMSGRTFLNRWQVLAWNPDWSDRDREMITAALDDVQSRLRAGDEPAFYLPESKAYIGAEVYGEYRTSASDQFGSMPRDGYYRAVAIHKGKIEWIGTAAEHMRLDRTHPLFHGMVEDLDDAFGAVKIRYWVPLSTFGHRPRGPKRPDGGELTCPECHLALPVSGVCDCR
jgi:hypothetical protein